MDTLDGMKTVVAVVETGSFTAAAERLNMSKALASKYVGEVERRLNVRLFQRSTRKLALTEAGKSYYQRALPLLEEFSELSDAVSGGQSSPQGLLRISVPVAFGEMKLAPLIPDFLQRYPDIRLELILNNSAVDMLAEGIDVRIRVGGVDDSSLVARPIKTLPLILCASPAYLLEHGEPKTAEDIGAHHCIIDSNFRIGEQWPLVSPTGQAHAVKVNSRIAASSPSAVKEIAIAGGGIGMVPRFIVEPALEQGLLQEVLPGYSSLEFTLFALYPHRRYLPRKVRCFIDFLVAEFSQQ
ncbi:LysR family transcriptional regulator [Gammaproteobacteria bacterium 53_120_T64]|nr:LysR family transcriptional regulator [Gammaproteobacteria bacterium 53_120_T64]